MWDFLATLGDSLWSTLFDVAPILAILVVFQTVVLRRKVPDLRRIAAGFALVLAGLALFLIGLQEALFPIGETMVRQLTAPETIGIERLADGVDWTDYLLVYAFAAAIGFSTTVAEPSLIAVALKAQAVSGGAVRAWGLRIAVASGGRRWRLARLLAHRHRHAAALVHHRCLCRCHCADLCFEPQHGAPRL